MRKSGYLIIEGNIGAGKSTLAMALTDAFQRAGLNAEFLPEPDESTNPFLKLYCENKTRWAYTMQCHLLHRRFASTLYAQAGAQTARGWFVLDRSFFGDLCFANVQRNGGFFTDFEFKSYVENNEIMRSFLHYPTAALFLQVSPEECVRRMKKRMETNTGRKCEDNYDLSYFYSIQCEINRLENFMKDKCDLRRLDWECEKSADEIAAVCDDLVRSLTDQPGVEPYDVYSPWGINGGKLWKIEAKSDLHGLAERENSK